MKRIIISQRHMQYLNEENTVNIAAQAKDNSLSSFSAAATDTNTASDVQKAKTAGDVNLVVTGPDSNDAQPKQVVNVAAGDTVQNAIADQASDDLIRNGGSVVLGGDGLGESYVFDKKTIEEARLAKMKRDGRVMTKKELRESLLQEEYDMNEGRIGRALGTLALGGALAFGGNNLKAQNMNQPQSVQMQQQTQEGYTFNCPQFKSDYETILNLADKHSGADREWAKSLLSNFPLDQNGAIHLEYIITCNQNIDIEQVMKTSYDWFNYSFSSAEQSVKGYDVEKGIIKARGSYLDLAQFNLNAVYYAKLVRVSADTDVILKFKENKIKIDVIVRNYNMIMANSAMQSRNSLVAVSDVFPVNSNSDNKVAYSRAFINAYAHSMDKVKKYIEFMTENMGGSSVFYDEDDWEIEDRKQNQTSQDMWDFNTPDNIKTKYFNLQKQIKVNKKNMRGLDKKSQDYITLENENNNLRDEMKKLDTQYKEITGNNIVQFEQPF